MASVLPTKREVLAELRDLIESERASNQERDGRIYDTRVLKSIACLEVALLVVKAAKFPQRRKTAPRERSADPRCMP